MKLYVVKSDHITQVLAHPPRRGDEILAVTHSVDEAFRLLTEERNKPDSWDRWAHRLAAVGLVAIMLFGPAIVDRPAEGTQKEVRK